ncbi:MAG: amino acid/polyamine/organocation transporter [Bacteroidetes bacterium]|nr:MAG: amino acid/polyamine/organocation transporter [Bacteroidota bacterium]
MSFSDLFRKKPVQSVLTEGGDGEGHGGMNRVLTVRDLTFFGIAAIIGGGTFSAIGSACFSGGPGVILLYIMCAVACGFTALCYAEFASRVPVSGSAYTYAYVSFGELFAWIIGWALLMEYSIGNIYIAFSWSGYFTNLLEAANIHLPAWLTINYQEAHNMFAEGQKMLVDFTAYSANSAATVSKEFTDWMASGSVQEALKSGQSLAQVFNAQFTGSEGYQAVANAPMIGGLHIIFDMPAFVINVFITYLVFIGTKESKNFSNLMVFIKLAIIVLIIIVGVFYIDIDNWTPFMPNGFNGVMAAVSGVFFAYIGFDAVSTLAEESKNPQRDLPRGMLWSLIICTIVFILLCLVLTGMASYELLGVSDPLAEVFKIKGVKWMLYIVSVAAVVAMTSVMLVFQMGQPRIWMTMSRDGLLPKRFSSIHPKYKTPAFATIITGLVVGIPLFFTNEKFILDFTSIGTLFAFVLVCGGVLMLPRRNREPGAKGFYLPYVNAKFIMPALLVVAATLIFVYVPEYITGRFDINADNAVENIPMIIFFLLCIVMTVFSFLRNLSLIPVLGLLSCCYLLTGMAANNWMWFGAWLVIGLVIYFLYSRRKSRLNSTNKA